MTITARASLINTRVVIHFLVAAAGLSYILGNRASATFNAWNLPTELRAYAAVGSGRSDQVSALTWDSGGPLTRGNLTRFVLASGTPSADATDLEYNDPVAAHLPSAAVSSVGARSLATYFRDGTPSQLTSPVNLLAPIGDPDRPASVSRIEQNSEELVSAFVDPLGHREEVSYNAEAPGSARLVITITHNDLSTRRITLDANGQAVKSVDENGVCSDLSPNRAGQPLRLRAAVGTASERAVYAFYDAHGDLCAFDPPGGSAGRVSVEYVRYNQSFGGGPPVKEVPEVYIGKPTRVVFPDGTSDYTGYNAMEEPEWRYRRDGRLATLFRDALHRVNQVDLPATPGYPAFSVSVVRDEFGRTVSMGDANGTSSFGWDDLNRRISASPAVGNPVSTQYLKDLTNQRWSERVTMTGVGTWEFGADTKGRPAEALNPFGQLTTRRFDLDGKPLRETRANGTYTDYGWTPRDWLAAIDHRLAGGAALDAFQYFYTDAQGVYDPTGHLRREVDSGNRTHAFFYNPLYEMTSESHPDFGTIASLRDANGNRTQKSAGGVTEYAGYDAANKLLWTNQAGNFAPTPNQAQPYRIYQYEPGGIPTRIDHRDAVGQGATIDQYDWDGMGKLRRILCVGTNQERYRAGYDGGGTRVTATLNAVSHTYSYGAGLLHDTAESAVYTPGISQRKNGVDLFFHPPASRVPDWIGSTMR